MPSVVRAAQISAQQSRDLPRQGESNARRLWRPGQVPALAAEGANRAESCLQRNPRSTVDDLDADSSSLIRNARNRTLPSRAYLMALATRLRMTWPTRTCIGRQEQRCRARLGPLASNACARPAARIQPRMRPMRLCTSQRAQVWFEFPSRGSRRWSIVTSKSADSASSPARGQACGDGPPPSPARPVGRRPDQAGVAAATRRRSGGPGTGRASRCSRTRSMPAASGEDDTASESAPAFERGRGWPASPPSGQTGFLPRRSRAIEWNATSPELPM